MGRPQERAEAFFFGLLSDGGGGRGLPTRPSLGLLFRRLFVVAGAAPSPSSCNLRRPPTRPTPMPKPTHSPVAAEAAAAAAVPPWAFRAAKGRDSERVRERPGTLKLRLLGGGTVPPHFYCIIKGGAGKR